MAKVVNLQKRELVARGFIGFSWETLFFGCLIPLFRGDWKWFFIMLIAIGPSAGFSNVIFGFIYNGIYTRDLLENKGYRPADDYSLQLLIQNGLLGANANRTG